MSPRTQKAAGVHVLTYFSLPNIPKSLRHILIQSASDLACLPSDDLPRFARPCPVRPRHGFVDSRPVHTLKELHAVWEEARAADPEAELLLGPCFKVDFSAVLAGSRLAIGKGNDGATAGRGTVEIGVVAPYIPTSVLSDAGIQSGETAYLECIADQYQRTYSVQLRAGPALPTSLDYIPAPITVAQLVTPDEDAIAWEERVTTLTPGSVVYAPGGSLASHAAVHCVLHGVPYVTTRAPVIGERLEPVGESAFVLDASEFWKGAAYADMLTSTGLERDAIMIALVTLHNWVELRKWPAASRFLGCAARGLAKVGAAICAAEARHYSIQLKRQRDRTHISRIEKLRRVLRASATIQRRQLTNAGKAFRMTGWKGGFGGSAWANCAKITDQLWRALSEGQTLSETSLMGAINNLINAAHNNGCFLNKLVTSTELDYAAQFPAKTALKVMGVLYSMATANATAAVPFVAARRMRKPPVVTYTHAQARPEAEGAKLHVYTPGCDNYVSIHLVGVPSSVRAWLTVTLERGVTTRSRHPESNKRYVPFALPSSLAATDLAGFTDALVLAAREGVQS